MGIYNTLSFKKNCPNCDAKVEWQTKDLIIDNLYPVERALMTFKLSKRMSGEVYTYCSKCKFFSEFKIKGGKLLDLKSEKHS